MRSILILLSLYLLNTGAFAQIQDQMIGKWEMETVMLGDKDVTTKHDPKDERWIAFHVNQQFFSGGAPYGENQGKWSVDEVAKTFFLDSDVENDDSEWHVWFEEGRMFWRGIGDPKKERFVISYINVTPEP